MNGMVRLVAPVAALLLSACGGADKTDQERLMEVLDEGGVPISAVDAGLAAKRLCIELVTEPRMHLEEATVWLRGGDDFRTMSAEQVGTFLGGAVAVYCPDKGEQVGIGGLV